MQFVTFWSLCRYVLLFLLIYTKAKHYISCSFDGVPNPEYINPKITNISLFIFKDQKKWLLWLRQTVIIEIRWNMNWYLVDSRLGALLLMNQICRTKRQKRISDSADTKMSAISCLLQVFIIFFQNKIHVPLFLCKTKTKQKTKQNKKATKLKATKFD